MAFKVYLLIILTFIVNNSVALGQDLQVSIQTDETTVRVNDLISVTVSVSGETRGGLPKPDLAYSEGLRQISSARSSGQSISIINGQYSITQSEQYTFSASKPGTYTIGPAAINFNGKKSTSNTLTIKVLAENEKAAGQNLDEDQLVFIKAVPSNLQPVIGEPVYIRFRLYYRTRINNVSLAQDASSAGMLSEAITTKRYAAQPDQEVINGLTYQVINIRELMVFPIQAGKLTLTPLVLNFQMAKPKVNNNRRSLFDDFLMDPFQEYKNVNKSSNAIEFNVKNIPNAPSDFSGFVGQLTASRSFSATEVEVNQPITITITYTGTGNFKNSIFPKLSFDSKIESYQPKEINKVFISDKGFAGTIDHEYIIIPRTSGNFQLPAINISYFDLASKSIKTITLPAQQLTVKGNTNQSITPGIAYDFRTIGRDISFIRTETEFIKESQTGEPYLIMTFAGIFLLWGGLFGWIVIYQQRLKEQSDTIGFAYKHADKFAKQSLNHVRKLADDPNNTRQILTEIHKVVSRFVANKAKLSETAWTVEEVIQLLVTKQIPSEKLTALEFYLNQLNEYRFAPISTIQKTHQELIQDAETYLADLSMYL